MITLHTKSKEQLEHWLTDELSFLTLAQLFVLQWFALCEHDAFTHTAYEQYNSMAFKKSPFPLSRKAFILQRCFLEKQTPFFFDGEEVQIVG